MPDCAAPITGALILGRKESGGVTSEQLQKEVRKKDKEKILIHLKYLIRYF